MSKVTTIPVASANGELLDNLIEFTPIFVLEIRNLDAVYDAKHGMEEHEAHRGTGDAGMRFHEAYTGPRTNFKAIYLSTGATYEFRVSVAQNDGECCFWEC